PSVCPSSASSYATRASGRRTEPADVASIRHQLLVAQPMLRDPNFNRTVVYMIEHTDDGALGVVLNRPGPVGVGEFLPEWEKVATEPRVLFKGGPVGQNSFVGLAVT